MEGLGLWMCLRYYKGETLGYLSSVFRLALCYTELGWDDWISPLPGSPYSQQTETQGSRVRRNVTGSKRWDSCAGDNQHPLLMIRLSVHLILWLSDNSNDACLSKLNKSNKKTFSIKPHQSSTDLSTSEDV